MESGTTGEAGRLGDVDLANFLHLPRFGSPGIQQHLPGILARLRGEERAAKSTKALGACCTNVCPDAARMAALEADPTGSTAGIDAELKSPVPTLENTGS